MMTPGMEEEMRDNIPDQFDDADWVAVAYGSNSQDWDWDAMSIYYSPSARRYFWYSDSGCSCSYHMEYVRSTSEFEDGTRHAAIEAAKNGGYESAATEIRAFDERGISL